MVRTESQALPLQSHQTLQGETAPDQEHDGKPHFYGDEHLSKSLTISCRAWCGFSQTRHHIEAQGAQSWNQPKEQNSQQRRTDCERKYSMVDSQPFGPAKSSPEVGRQPGAD